MKPLSARIQKRLGNFRIRLHPLGREIGRHVRANSIIKRAAVSNEHRYCYFRIPKCANSTIVKTLAHHDPGMRVSADDPKGRRSKKRFTHLLKAEATGLDDLQRRFYLFTFVRNPYSRLLSAYLDKLGRTGGTYDFVRRALGMRPGEPVPFERFITYLERGGLYKNPHWAPQRSVLPIRPARLHFIGGIETLEDGLKTVIERVYGPGSFQGLQERTANRQEAAAKLREYYTPELASRVYTLSRGDFEAFGYPRGLTGT